MGKAQPVVTQCLTLTDQQNDPVALFLQPVIQHFGLCGALCGFLRRGRGFIRTVLTAAVCKAGRSEQGSRKTDFSSRILWHLLLMG